jgi:hypothetical protein
MRSGGPGAAPVIRMWWTLPLGLVVLTAVVFVAVVLPALATRPTVPSQLVVNRSPSSPAPTSTSTSTPTPTPRRTSASPVPTRSTTVVVPEQPVVRESDDRHDDGGGSASEEPRDR